MHGKYMFVLVGSYGKVSGECSRAVLLDSGGVWMSETDKGAEMGNRSVHVCVHLQMPL